VSAKWCNFATQNYLVESAIIHTISSAKQSCWIEDIVGIRNNIGSDCENLCITIDGNVQKKALENYHIVTLACLLDYAKRMGVDVYLNIVDEELEKYIFGDMRLKMYLTLEQNIQYSTPEKQPFNIWRIEEQFTTNYAIALTMFFKNNYFVGKDISGLNNCIVELFQNVIDHSCSNGTAFVAISYDKAERQISIAICDFGVGIPYTLRKQYNTDCEALSKCLLRGVSANTNKHNFGYGMENVVSTMGEKDILKIVSNRALLLKTKEREITSPLKFDFKGTLIYFTIPTDSFETEEIIDQFAF